MLDWACQAELVLLLHRLIPEAGVQMADQLRTTAKSLSRDVTDARQKNDEMKNEMSSVRSRWKGKLERILLWAWVFFVGKLAGARHYCCHVFTLHFNSLA